MLLEKRDTGLRVFLARDVDGSLRGFAVLAIDRDVGYYLHGASDARGKREGVADLLLESLVTTARTQGARSLSLMASPWEQRGLIRFKQKWGDTTGLCVTNDVATGPIGMAARAVSWWMGRGDRQSAADWRRGEGDPHR
jgi:GNAT superfamily N-acetyltransferase